MTCIGQYWFFGAKLLRHGDQLDAVLRQLADVELKLEMVAEEPAERVDDDDIEGSGLRRAGLHHPLELRTPIVRRRRARLDIGFDQFIAPSLAIGLALTPLVGDRDVMLGLPRR